MAEYATPGVYVEEVPAAVKPIAGVGTSTAGFIGIVEYGEVDPTVEALMDRTLYETLPLAFSPSSGEKLRQHIIDRIKKQFAGPNATVQLSRHRPLTELQADWKLAETIDGVTGAEAGSVLTDGTDGLIAQIKQRFPDPSKTVKVTEDGQQVDKHLQDLRPDMMLAVAVPEVPTVSVGALTEPFINAIKQQFPDPNKTVAVIETEPAKDLTADTTLTRLEVEAPKGKIPEDLAYLIYESSKTWETAKKVKVVPLTPAGRATLCTNFGEFTSAFGGFSAAHTWQNWLAHAVYGFFNNGGTRCWCTRADTPFFPAGTLVTAENVKDVVKAALGRREVQVTASDPAKEPKPTASSVTPTATEDNLEGKWLAEDILDNSKLSGALDTFKPIDEIALVAIPGAIDQAVHTALIDHCENQHLQDRFAILDGKRLSATTSPTVSAISSGVRNSSYGAVYFPWITMADPNTQTTVVPPSGHLAGVYARVDTTRGVHKAPANEVIRGALDVERVVSKAQQADLNHPAGINVLRKFDGNVTVWGARTWAGAAGPEWRYINVRRLFLYLRKSIDQGTQWVVFEPNDPGLWAKIQRNVTAFLTNVWRAGALFGATPQEAFYVKCDAETNPPELRDMGRVVTEIGVAVVKPAEFVVFRISQWAGPGS